MFRKLTAIEPVSLEDWAEEKLHTYAEEVVLYKDIPENDEEVILQPLFRGERQCRYCLRQRERNPCTGHPGLRRPGRGRIRFKRAGAVPSRV